MIGNNIVLTDAIKKHWVVVSNIFYFSLCSPLFGEDSHFD